VRAIGVMLLIGAKSIRALPIATLVLLLSGGTRAEELPPGHERWVGASGSRVVDMRDLRPAAAAELHRLLEAAGYTRATAGGMATTVRRDLQVLVENQGRFPAGYRPAGHRPAATVANGRARPAGTAAPEGAWLAEREAAVAARRLARRILRAFGQ
jgi:hypothetical protein